MDQTNLAWKLLSNSIGKYFGTGMNHQGQKYEGQISLTDEIPNKLIHLKSQAKGINGEIFHEEISWIGRDISGALSLFVNSNNHPGITPHLFDRLEEAKDGTKKIIFKFGNIADQKTFREEICFSIHTNYNIEHTYSWGLPGGLFEPRSTALMKKML